MPFALSPERSLPCVPKKINQALKALSVIFQNQCRCPKRFPCSLRITLISCSILKTAVDIRENLDADRPDFCIS